MGEVIEKSPPSDLQSYEKALSTPAAGGASKPQGSPSSDCMPGAAGPNGASGYRGANKEKREIASWRPENISADEAILPGKDLSESRARDLIRNNGFASGALDSAKDRIVGSRYKLNLQPNYIELGISFEEAQKWARMVEAKFHSYADDPDCWIDAARTRTFTQMIRDAEAGRSVSGESIRTREWREDNPGLKTCFLSIEPARISTPTNIDGFDPTDDIREGVELGRYGDPIAYHLRSKHPSDLTRLGGTRLGLFDEDTWQRITRLNSFGYQNVFHIYEHVEEGHQTRGISRFAPILQQFKMLARYEDAALEAAIISAIYTFFVKSKLPDQEIFAALQGADFQEKMAELIEYQQAQKDGKDLTVDGQQVVHLMPDEDLQAIKPEHPIAGFETFEAAMHRHMAKAVGDSYENFTGDYSKTTYSSARMSSNNNWQHIESRRESGASKDATNIMRAVVDEMVLYGHIDLPEGVTNYADSRAALTQCKWIGAGKPIVDEVKSANANKIKLETGETTLRDICAEQGKDWEDIIRQRARERAFAKDIADEMGLVVDDKPEIAAEIDDNEAGDE